MDTTVETTTDSSCGADGGWGAATASPRGRAATSSAAEDDDGTSGGAAAELLAPALAEVIALSLTAGQQGAQSVAPGGPAHPSWCAFPPEPCGGQGAAGAGDSAAGAKKRAADAERPTGGQQPCSKRRLWGGGDGGGTSPPAGAGDPWAVAGGATHQDGPAPAAPRPPRRLQPLRLDLGAAGLDGAPTTPAAAAGPSPAPGSAASASEWIDRMEAQLSSRGNRGGCGAGGPPQHLPVPPAFVCLGLLGGGCA